MERLTWESFSFAPGVHTHHEWAPGGEIYARDMRNLRADENAYLLLRQRTGSYDPAVVGAAVTGLFASDRHLFWIENGELHALNLADGEQAEIEGITDLAGRLYIVDAFDAFYIGKSEGTNRGFWMDLSDNEFIAYNLGLAPPALARLGAQFRVYNGPRLTTGYVYIYRFTYVRVQGDYLDVMSRGTAEVSQNPLLFEGMESDLSAPQVFYVGNGAGVTFRQFRDKDKNVYTPTATGAGNNVIVFSGFEQSADPQATGVFLYQSEPVPFGGDPMNVDTLEYRLVDYVPRGDASQLLGVTAYSREAQWSEQPKARFDNHRLPAVAAQIHFFNDLVFAATGESLRYSDVRDGVPAQWAWPEANSIRGRGKIVFCVEYLGVLLFGGPQGIWRLTGVDEFSFDRDRLSAIGPVSREAWGEFENGIGFIASGGLFITNGTSVEKLSSPFLDGYFEASKAVDGSVTHLPNDDELWAVVFESGARIQFLRSSRGGFFPWSEAYANQFASLHDGDVVFADSSTSAVRTIEFDAQVDENLGWYWLSQVIDFKEQGHAEALKLFKWLEVSSSVDGEAQLQIIVDGVSADDFKDVTLRANAQRPSRVRINRRGERIQFRLFGQGDVAIRYLRLVSDVRTGRSRF